MGDFTYAENTDLHYMYDHAISNGTVELRMYHTQVPDQQVPDHRIFQQLHRLLCKTRSFHITRHDAVHRQNGR
ncbi:hypothetical protein TNCV_4195711 [Trichonephila clavipes]|nr:hypothetical protein TNCV_4195711 [Trichonephila clavipes]